MFKRLYPLYEAEGAMGAASSSVVTEELSSGDGNALPPTNESAETASAEDVSKQESFAKRLKESTDKAISDERAKWEKENSEKYKDYDLHKELSGYLSEINGGMDLLALKERKELEALQDRAELNQMSPDMQRRMDELESKAARLEEIENQRQTDDQTRQEEKQQQQLQKTYWDNLNQFAKGKEMEGDALNQFMVENEYYVNPENMERSFDLAYKAMMHDELVKQVGNAEKEGMKKLIHAKGSIPTVSGSNAQGQVVNQPPKTFAEARARALIRMTGEG